MELELLVKLYELRETASEIPQLKSVYSREYESKIQNLRKAAKSKPVGYKFKIPIKIQIGKGIYVLYSFEVNKNKKLAYDYYFMCNRDKGTYMVEFREAAIVTNSHFIYRVAERCFRKYKVLTEKEYLQVYGMIFFII